MDCWARQARALKGDAGEIAAMFLEGAASREYRHTDVLDAMTALGLTVDLTSVREHRLRNCACYEETS